jgi:hypothetical protein
VRPPDVTDVPQCGGIDMVSHDSVSSPASPLPGFEDGCLIGKRYRAVEHGLEVLCTKGGSGTLGFKGQKLELVEAKKLPASD